MSIRTWNIDSDYKINIFKSINFILDGENLCNLGKTKIVNFSIQNWASITDKINYHLLLSDLLEME